MTHPLLDRLRSATCGSRELDRAAAEGAGLRVWDEKVFDFHTGPTDRTTPVVGNDSDGWDLLPAYSSSLDAALGLVERVLPGWERTELVYLAGLAESVEEYGSWDGPPSQTGEENAGLVERALEAAGDEPGYKWDLVRDLAAALASRSPIPGEGN